LDIDHFDGRLQRAVISLRNSDFHTQSDPDSVQDAYIYSYPFTYIYTDTDSNSDKHTYDNPNSDHHTHTNDYANPDLRFP
jgi:hypothetical protein